MSEEDDVLDTLVDILTSFGIRGDHALWAAEFIVGPSSGLTVKVEE